MNSIIELYSYIDSIKNVTDKIIKIDSQEFIDNEEIISASYAIFKELINYLVKLNDMFILHSELNILVKEIYESDRFMMNEYKMINSYMLCDFFKTDYQRLTKIVSELIK